MRKAFIPEFWVTSDLGDAAFRTLAVLALHKDKEDRCFLTNETIAGILNKDPRRVRSDLLRAEQLKLIARKYTDRGQRFFVLLMNEDTADEKRPGRTQNDRPENDRGGRKTSGGADAERPGGRTENVHPPNNPLIGTTVLNNVSLQLASTHTREPFEPELATSLPADPPIVRLAQSINDVAERWVKSHLRSGTNENDWRLKEVLREIIARGTNVSSPKYLEPMFKDLPEQKPEPTVAKANSSETKRITTKDGKKVLIDGEWLLAKTPYENMPAETRVESKLGDEFNRFVHEIHGLKLDMDCRIQAEMDLLGIFDQASAGTIDAGQFKQQAASLIQKLKGAVA